ncbi:MAG: methyltransferase [Chromatiaceae bacterium]|jgi:tRNA1(Val) A37 N6-methylase TrmN6|nr:methyltransferase [Chromatiaceae bacterium]
MPASDELTLDALAGDWRIWQLRQGHRFSADDLLTAWTAANARPDASRVLDLGSGIGSVGLLTLWRLAGEARLTLVEVQELSHGLARRTVAHNGLEDRVSLRNLDLRDWPGGEFDLVTGSPPYLPPAQGTVSPHPQKAAARFELRGDVFDYCRAAARSLSEDGVFCFCHAARDPRPETAVAAAGLKLRARQEVHFRAHQPPMIALFTCARSGTCADPPPLALRDPRGEWTPAYLRIRAEMGAPAEFLRRAAARAGLPERA